MPPVYNVRVEGLSRLAAMPGFLERAQRDLLDRSSKAIGDEVRKRAPGGPDSAIGRDVEARALSSTIAVIRSKGHPGAKALERGAFIRSRRGAGTAIRFNTPSGPIFVRSPRGVRIKARGFYRRGLRTRSKHVREAFGQTFGNLPGGARG